MSFTLYEKIMIFVSIWTSVEGALIVLTPKSCQKVATKLFRGYGKMISEMPPGDLRKLGAVEMAFGFLLGAYLFYSLGS